MSEQTVQTSRSIGHPTKREVIVDSALRLILKNGYDGTTVDDVASMSGVSKGLVSYHFPKKDALFRAVLRRSCTGSRTTSGRSTRPTCPPANA